MEGLQDLENSMWRAVEEPRVVSCRTAGKGLMPGESKDWEWTAAWCLRRRGTAAWESLVPVV